jgi:peptidyl-prolyl cis-trans isomerase SurA
MTIRRIPSPFLAALVGGAALLLFQAEAAAQTRELATKGELLDRVAAVVGDGVVLNSELEDQIVAVSERLQQQKLELPPQNVLRQQVLERLVLQEIQAQRAAKAGLKVPDETLNAALTDVAQRNNIPLSQLPEALQQQGIDYASYREDVRKELTLSLLRQRDVLQRISVTPREIDEYLEKQAKAPAADLEYNVSHILIAVPQEATAAQLDDAAKRATDVYTRAKSGEDFAKLALAYSKSQTALEGGALGWRKGGELPTFLTDVVAKLKVGEVSEPLRTPTGYHIVRLNEVRGGGKKGIEEQVHIRHILMKTNELADDATVRQKLSQLRERILKGEDFAGLAQTTARALRGVIWVGPVPVPSCPSSRQLSPTSRTARSASLSIPSMAGTLPSSSVVVSTTTPTS